MSSVASAQLQRLDSIVARSVAGMLQSAQDVRITYDSSLSLLRSFLPPGAGSRELRVTSVDALLDTSRTPAALDISVQSALPGDPRESRRWTATEKVDLTANDRAAIETNSLRYVKLSHSAEQSSGSLWSSYLEPALVVVGAGLIVALFFLIRS